MVARIKVDRSSVALFGLMNTAHCILNDTEQGMHFRGIAERSQKRLTGIVRIRQLSRIGKLTGFCKIRNGSNVAACRASRTRRLRHRLEHRLGHRLGYRNYSMLTFRCLSLMRCGRRGRGTAFPEAKRHPLLHRCETGIDHEAALCRADEENPGRVQQPAQDRYGFSLLFSVEVDQNVAAEDDIVGIPSDIEVRRQKIPLPEMNQFAYRRCQAKRSPFARKVTVAKREVCGAERVVTKDGMAGVSQ